MKSLGFIIPLLKINYKILKLFSRLISLGFPMTVNDYYDLGFPTSLKNDYIFDLLDENIFVH